MQRGLGEGRVLLAGRRRRTVLSIFFITAHAAARFWATCITAKGSSRGTRELVRGAERVGKRKKLDDVLPPRVLSERESAYYIGRSEFSFHSRRAALESQGFPRIDPLTGGRDLRAIDAWLDRRSGLREPRDAQISDVSNLIRRRLTGIKNGTGRDSTLSG